ncbi:hypothetical protein [Actinokineospora sp. NPDC004072]
MLKRRVWGAVAVAVGAVLLAGLATYLVVIGLDAADKVASVVGAFAGVLALVVGILQLRRGGGAEPGGSVRNEISGNARVTGPVIQAHTVHERRDP